ncbi:hypothetical protein OCU72_09820, partial [Escherichia coli]|nr:hypothetical protein [Escherichia coli]
FLRTAVNDFMDCVHHIWCPLFSQEFQDLPDGAETTLTEVAAKDEFLNIKNVSRDDMMAAHRVPPQMMGIMPNNVGGFGDVEKASRVFVRNELIPLQKRLQELNNWLGDEVIRFEPYTLDIQNEKK